MTFLTTIPLFVLLGEILLRAGITRNMYESLTDWLSRMPVAFYIRILEHVQCFRQFGSSVATAATIGTVALDEFKRRAYNEPLVLGSIAAGATLGISDTSFSQPNYLWCINEYIDRPIVRSRYFARDPAYRCFHDNHSNCGSLEAITGRTSY